MDKPTEELLTENGEAMPKKRAARRSKKKDDTTPDTSVSQEKDEIQAAEAQDEKDEPAIAEDSANPADGQSISDKEEPTDEALAADNDPSNLSLLLEPSLHDEESDGLSSPSREAIPLEEQPTEPAGEYENETFDFGTSDAAVSSDGEDSADTRDKEEVYNPKKPRSGDLRFDIVEIFTFTLVVIILITTFLFRHSVVDGDSMMNTLNNGDHLIITNAFYTPKRYDIVVFEDHSTGFEKALIKRVIATAGETVVITPDGEVFVDGERLSDEFVYTCHEDPDYPLEYTVAEGEVFVMGDHRCCSTDSRSFGAIKESSILGKVILRFYPFADFGTVN